MPNDSNWAITVQDLKKDFRSRSGVVHALRGVSFNVPRGGVFCILGPNGAGKTTLLRILTTMMRPGSGSAWIEGVEIGRQNLAIRRNIGIVAQDNHFDHYLSVWQNLILHAQMHGLSNKEAEARVTELLKQVDLYERRKDVLEGFSGGMKRRVSLIRALVHQPTVLFLDEPTTGLDPAARRDLWDTIESIRERTTVILTTHYMDEADRLSNRILILEKGAVTMEGTASELKRTLSPPDTYELSLTTPTAETYRQRLEPFILNSTVMDNHLLRFQLKSPDVWSALNGEITLSDLSSLGHVEVDLETVYLSIAGYGEKEASI